MKVRDATAFPRQPDFWRFLFSKVIYNSDSLSHKKGKKPLQSLKYKQNKDFLNWSQRDLEPLEYEG